MQFVRIGTVTSFLKKSLTNEIFFFVEWKKMKANVLPSHSHYCKNANCMKMRHFFDTTFQKTILQVYVPILHLYSCLSYFPLVTLENKRKTFPQLFVTLK